MVFNTLLNVISRRSLAREYIWEGMCCYWQNNLWRKTWKNHARKKRVRRYEVKKERVLRLKHWSESVCNQTAEFNKEKPSSGYLLNYTLGDSEKEG